MYKKSAKTLINLYSRSPVERRNLRNGLLFISPWLVGFAIFTAYPIAASLYYSMCRYRVLSPPEFVGLANYAKLAHDEYFWKALGNTVFMLIEVPLGVIFGLGIALLLNQKLKGMAFFRTVFYLPAVVPVVASAMVWLWVLNPQYGLLNDFLGKLGLPALPWLASPAWSKPSMIMMDLWAVGAGMIIYLAALQGVPEQLYEAAELDGASGWQKIRHVTIPQVSPVIFYLSIMGIIGAFQYFTQTFIMTQGGPDNSTLFYALYLFQNAFERFKMGYACAMAWVLFILTLGATLVIFKTSARWVYYEGESGG